MEQVEEDRKKIEQKLKDEWEALASEFSEADRSSLAYLVKWNYLHAYERVWTDTALGLPLDGRFADAATDAKASLRLVECVLQRQFDAEAKINRLVRQQHLLLALVGVAVIIGFMF